MFNYFPPTPYECPLLIIHRQTTNDQIINENECWNIANKHIHGRRQSISTIIYCIVLVFLVNIECYLDRNIDHIQEQKEKHDGIPDQLAYGFWMDRNFSHEHSDCFFNF